MTGHPTDDLTARIRAVDDGELTHAERAHPYAVVGPQPGTRSFLYVTKRHALERLLGTAEFVPSFGVIARYGLPSASDCQWIASLVGDRRLLFLGDCAPYDLLVYRWLQHYFEISYLGVSDQVVELLGVDVRSHITISLNELEQQALELVCSEGIDVPGLVGERCGKLLHSGRKLEIEAIISFASQPLNRLFDAIP